jgi:hypothetical protein
VHLNAEEAASVLSGLVSSLARDQAAYYSPFQGCFCGAFSSMGLTFSSLFDSFTSLIRWSQDQDVRILMLGLDSAGKVCCSH